MKNFNTQIHSTVFLLLIFVVVGPYILCNSQEEEEDIFTAPMEEKEQKALYYAIQGFVGKWWNGSDLYPDPCGWTPIQGVSCDLFNGSWYVTAFNIGPVYDNSLRCAPNAEFSYHLFELNHLKSLSFYNCFILPRRRTIPISNWDKLANSLETLEFRSNPSLIGAIPTAFGCLRSLQSLVLLENGLTGKLPVDIGNLVNLKQLVLAGNHFVGQIPANWGTSLTQLLILDSSRNSLSGSLPLTFGGLTSLLKLDLSNNLLEGVLPKQIGTLKNLTLLDLGNNKFSGGLTQSLHEMVSLGEMVLSNNPLMGGDLMSIQWETLENLEFLDLSSMGLTGNIPESMTELKRLRFLGLTNNSLSGNVSPRFEAMPCLGALYFHGNNLTGKLEFSESFYRKMGSRFGASNNPNLCYSLELMASSYVPFGVKLCQQENSILDGDSVIKMGDGNVHQDYHFVASLGFSSSDGHRFFWANEITMFVVWIIMLL